MDEDLIRDGIPAMSDSEAIMNMHVDGRIWHAAIMRGNKLVIWGGETKKQAVKEGFLVINLDTGKKRILKSLLRNDSPVYRGLQDHKRPFFATCYKNSAYAVDGNFLYTFGGLSLVTGEAVNYFFRFEFCQDSRSENNEISVDKLNDIEKREYLSFSILHANNYKMTSRPSPRSSHNLFIYDNKAYSFGGYGPPVHDGHLDEYGNWHQAIGKTIGWNNQLLIYDFKSKSSEKWSNPYTSGNVPFPRAAHGMCVVGSGAYLFGGWSCERCHNDLYHLDLNKLQWTSILRVGVWPCERLSATLTLLSNDRLFVFGGCGRDHHYGDGYFFDLKTNRFRVIIKDQELTRRTFHASVLTNDNRVITVGGRMEDRQTNDWFYFDNFLQLRLCLPPSLYVTCLRHCTKNIATYSEKQLKCLNEKIRVDILNYVSLRHRQFQQS